MQPVRNCKAEAGLLRRQVALLWPLYHSTMRVLHCAGPNHSSTAEARLVGERICIAAPAHHQPLSVHHPEPLPRIYDRVIRPACHSKGGRH